MTGTSGVASVERAISILVALSECGRPMSLSEVSQVTGLYKSTILRLCASLERSALIQRTSDGRFKLGFGLIGMGEAAKRVQDLRSQIYSLLESLVAQTGESASYYVVHGGKRLCLCRVDSPKSVRDHIREGDVLPLDQGAAGRILHGSFMRQHGAIGNVADLIQVSLGERDAEAAAVAGPVVDGDGLIGALSVSGPLTRFGSAEVAKFRRIVQAACQELSRLAGGNLDALVRRATSSKRMGGAGVSASAQDAIK